MPTVRPRHTITETERVARALDDAARCWPADRDDRVKLLHHLLEEGHQAVIRQREQETNNRREAISQTSGALTGVYGTTYLSELREDWPE